MASRSSILEDEYMRGRYGDHDGDALVNKAARIGLLGGMAQMHQQFEDYSNSGKPSESKSKDAPSDNQYPPPSLAEIVVGVVGIGIGLAGMYWISKKAGKTEGSGVGSVLKWALQKSE
jgi:hypothetical protein